ncbi:DUF2129 domain-containing protein [Gemelliphila asaccharolytica]|uniref:DUF2129 domain-containing protein n=1 Tax=Gemelliphila asaccharolytica TaxID=502393 RepID=A0ABR5TLV3_9BACL|nr:DUF2129 domain-containing protein [Gemella asaccharolytica]KXB58025.1 hypothetical protein HMPREF1871_00691 [Gemella asaccharolytica]
MNLFLKKRKGLYIYFKHTKDINKLKKYGNIIVCSAKNRYLYMYTDEDKIDDVIYELSNKRYINKLIKSELAELYSSFDK